MFQVISMWNLAKPNEEMEKELQNIEQRGYNSETCLTGEFARKLADKKIKPLSTSNIADKYCPVRRDLYYEKGIKRLSKINKQRTWGMIAGNMVENHIEKVFNIQNNDLKEYSALLDQENKFHEMFIEEQKKAIEKMGALEDTPGADIRGDTSWLLNLLKKNGRAELSIKILHSLLKEDDSLDHADIEIKKEIQPNIGQIGINSPACPDFIIPKFGIVGDVKTGVEFKNHFQLTCAGYALAYENEKKDPNFNINWGVIYFFPTRIPSQYVRSITYPQLYIFPITDFLREWFLDTRDEAYNIISKDEFPNFPDIKNRKHCKHCSFEAECIKQGM